MRKTSPYYFAVLALMNGLAAFIAPTVNGAMLRFYATFLEGKRLPPLTEFVLTWPPITLVFCILFLAGFVIGAFTKASDSMLIHVFGIVVSVELLAVFIMMTAYAAPFFGL